MFQHTFLFSPGTWRGEGKITLSMVEEELLFETSWVVQPKDFAGKISGSQKVEIHGLSDQVQNELTFSEFDGKHFSVEMENSNVGRVLGTGVFDEKVVGWEFRNNDLKFEGYETYTLQGDGSYQMRGEYVTNDQFRTHIEAHLWFQSKEVQSVDESDESPENEEEM